MNYIIVTGLLIAGAYFLRALARFQSYAWKSRVHEIFSTIQDNLCDPVSPDDIARARNWCNEGKRKTITEDGDPDFRLWYDLGVTAAVIGLFVALGIVHNSAMSDLRKELTEPQQEQVKEQLQPAEQEE